MVVPRGNSKVITAKGIEVSSEALLVSAVETAKWLLLRGLGILRALRLSLVGTAKWLPLKGLELLWKRCLRPLRERHSGFF